jgi:hypothetical protein
MDTTLVGQLRYSSELYGSSTIDYDKVSATELRRTKRLKCTIHGHQEANQRETEGGIIDIHSDIG